jgi:hypothetical protein
VTPREILHLYIDAAVDAQREHCRDDLDFSATPGSRAKSRRRRFDLDTAVQTLMSSIALLEARGRTAEKLPDEIRKSAALWKDARHQAWLGRVAADVAERLGLTGHPLPSSDDLPEDPPAAPPAAAPPAEA